MHSEKSYYSGVFSHIYVEKRAKEFSRTKKILKQFPQSRVIEIDHYKDVFCRRGQNPQLQVNGKALILAVKEGQLVYEGANVCQSFGNEYFYYTSCVMNCLYDCEYCYLKGMYPSGHMVVFVNLEDIFAEIEKILEQHSAYICISYDTDLMPLENLTGFIKSWIDFANKYEELKIEIRTKCGRTDIWEKMSNVSKMKNIIFAFTISPEIIAKSCEHGASSMESRLTAAALALEKGCSVRLCFDPMIYCQNWREHYDAMMTMVEEKIDLTKLVDVSVGSFRISQDYLKRMRRNALTSQIVQFPYQNINGVYQYPKEILEEMEQYMTERLMQHLLEDKIFRW